MARREYQGQGITVHWDSDRCIYSHVCVLSAPDVFDYEARPWVDVDGSSADTLARVIDACPSGALSYTRTDGALNGRRGHGADEDPVGSTRSDNDVGPGSLRPVTATSADDLPTITAVPNGPLLISGPFGIARDDDTIEIVDRLALCRCGGSGSKPHCDGSHARGGFMAPGANPAPDKGRQVVIRSGGTQVASTQPIPEATA